MEILKNTGMLVGYTMGMEPSGRECLVVAIKGTISIPAKVGCCTVWGAVIWNWNPSLEKGIKPFDPNSREQLKGISFANYFSGG